MSNLTITGKIDKINATQQISDTFSKREFIIESGDKYPQFINFELVKDKVELIDNFKIGDSITVHFNVDGRKWTNPKTNEERCFNSLKAWKIELDENVSNSENTPVKASTEDLPF